MLIFSARFKQAPQLFFLLLRVRRASGRRGAGAHGGGWVGLGEGDRGGGASSGAFRAHHMDVVLRGEGGGGAGILGSLGAGSALSPGQVNHTHAHKQNMPHSMKFVHPCFSFFSCMVVIIHEHARMRAQSHTVFAHTSATSTHTHDHNITMSNNPSFAHTMQTRTHTHPNDTLTHT